MSTQSSQSPQATVDEEEHGAEFPSVWRRLTEPHESIEEVGVRHLARVLSGFLLVCVVAGSVGMPVLMMSSPQSMPAMVGAIIVFAGIYFISRSRRHRLGVVMTVLVCVVGPIVSIYIGQPSSDITVSHMSWTITAVILGSAYLSLRPMLLVVLACVVVSSALFAVLPALTREALVNVIWFLLTLSAMILTMAYHRNAVEKKRLAVIAQRSVELARLNRSMETMLHVISHDLKEPLRAIQNFSRMVEKRYADKLDDKGQDFLQRVVRGARRMRDLLDDLLQLSQAQRIEQPKTPVPGAEIVADALGRLEEVIAETGAEIRVADDLPAFRVNKSWASGAIYNLVDNAIKYAAEGVRPEVEIAAYRGPRGLGLVVKDRGPGVAPEHRERIFELFQRAVSRDVPGTGAGLAIVRQIAERHGGAAWVEPRHEGGSAFHVAFQGPGAAIQRL